MRRITLAFGAATLCAVAVPVGALADGQSGDRVSGSGKFQGQTQQIIVEAHEGGNGETRGKVHYRVAGVGTIDADVTCVDADGNLAVVAGVVTRGTGGFSDRTTVKLAIMDNGPPALLPDAVSISTEQGTECTFPNPFQFHLAEQGNFVVQDRG